MVNFFPRSFRNVRWLCECIALRINYIVCWRSNIYNVNKDSKRPANRFSFNSVIIYPYNIHFSTFIIFFFCFGPVMLLLMDILIVINNKLCQVTTRFFFGIWTIPSSLKPNVDGFLLYCFLSFQLEYRCFLLTFNRFNKEKCSKFTPTF